MAIIMMLPIFYVGVFHVQKFFVQIEMKQKLKHEQLVTLYISANKVQWYKKGKEIIVDGSLFDVKRITYNNGMATVQGLYDSKEKEINKQIAKANSKSQNNRLNTTLIKLLGFYFISAEQFTTEAVTAFASNTPQLGCTGTDRLPVHFLSVPTPPPLG